MKKSILVIAISFLIFSCQQQEINPKENDFKSVLKTENNSVSNSINKNLTGSIWTRPGGFDSNGDEVKIVFHFVSKTKCEQYYSTKKFKAIGGVSVFDYNYDGYNIELLFGETVDALAHRQIGTIQNNKLVITKFIFQDRPDYLVNLEYSKKWNN
jgi:hypothetical protein